MIAYLLLGTGVTLVLGSVLYTYRVDRKVNSGDVSRTPELTQNPVPPTNPYVKTMKSAQIKESIGTIGEGLDELIDELKEKEAEVKQLVKRVKGWQSDLPKEDLPKSGFQEIFEQKLASQEVAAVEEPIVETQPAVKEKPSTASETDTKYDQIARLLAEGRSVEEIARLLNMGLGEVELVAKIRKKG